MTLDAGPAKCTWLRTGDEILRALLAAVDEARRSVCLEMYIVDPGPPAEKMLAALLGARKRGARVRVLFDALGSSKLPALFWQPLAAAGGEVRQFNPLSLRRLGIRDHRKLLLCDDRFALIGGFNLGPEYEGDGVTRGWCDLGLALEAQGSLAAELAAAFDAMFARADFKHKRFVRFHRSTLESAPRAAEAQLLLGGPGRGPNPITQALRRDLARARSVQIMEAYFLPTGRIRRDLMRVVQRGGRVQLLLAGKSDVRVSQLAGRSLYRRFLRAGVEVYEYQPQILHAKLIIIDDVVYAGSANLDQRSLTINYELALRFTSPALAAEARRIFEERLQHSRQITREAWRHANSFWGRLQQRWAYFLLVRVDSFIARVQWRRLPD